MWFVVVDEGMKGGWDHVNVRGLQRYKPVFFSFFFVPLFIPERKKIVNCGQLEGRTELYRQGKAAGGKTGGGRTDGRKSIW